jgi:ribosomal protein S17E
MWYRKIDKRMWGDARFCRLSGPQPCGQALWVYLLTGPHTTSLPGLFLAGEAGLAEALGWPLEGFRKAFQELYREGLAEADWKARLVWIPNVVKYNQPENPNVVKGWRPHYDELPECSLKVLALQQLGAAISHREGLAKAFTEAFGEPLAKGMANQEQEQEQEQEPPLSPPRGGNGGGEQSRITDPKRPLTVSDDPVRGSVAQKLVRLYQEQVNPTWAPGCGDVAALERLQDGISEQRLRNAVAGYADHCTQNIPERKQRESAKKFFSLEGQHGAFLDWRPAAPPQPKQPKRPTRPDEGVPT